MYAQLIAAKLKGVHCKDVSLSKLDSHMYDEDEDIIKMVSSDISTLR